MVNDTLRRRILQETALQIHRNQESNYRRARHKAIRKLGRRWVRRDELPSNAEIRHELLSLAYQQENEFLAEYGSPIDEHLPESIDRWEVYESLLLPLAEVSQSRKSHPEGDALYHSLQVFTLARDERPYDEEFLLAALLHDVGKALDPKDHVAAGLDALEGVVSERTEWLIAHHLEARKILDGTIGARARRRMAESESFEELLLFAECDRDGRMRGMVVPDVDEALQTIRDLNRLCG